MIADLGYRLQCAALVCALALLGHLIQGIDDLGAVLTGLGVLLAITMTGYVAAALMQRQAPQLARRLPDIFWISTVAIVAGLPVHPVAGPVVAACEPLSLVAVMTPIMAFASLGVSADEIRLFRRTGLQMIVISLLVFTGTFLGSALIADLLL